MIHGIADRSWNTSATRNVHLTLRAGLPTSDGGNLLLNTGVTNSAICTFRCLASSPR